MRRCRGCGREHDEATCPVMALIAQWWDVEAERAEIETLERMWRL